MSDLGLYRTLGVNLIDQGKKFLNKATPIEKTQYSASQFLTAIRACTGLGVNAIYDADNFHHTTDIETWKMLIENDWTNKKIWTEETFDCDNFAGSFSSYVADIYGLNSCARITVELLNPTTKNHIGWHRCCLIIDANLQGWLLETQSDKMVKMELGVNPIIDNWEYKPNRVDIN